ncbi:nucleotidyltransferase family protein [Variovorax sp. J22R133]|uniref:nucleotidyltransferase family protein n=1 Tax=Variovorax brevis TaxID=3053503 RepID=UPI002578F7C6|nr:nucleotidyltransferase family protein [Variovorax sp. J22R133]MDM0111780.1 nucleotidyltransferase family protein [Variovorax sp. J22R133]
MVLAAGRGERMRPLTDTTPKPLLLVQGKPLMQWAMEALARGGFDQVLINTAWLGEQIPAHFGERFVARPAGHAEVAMSVSYSHEGRDFGDALETTGGIVRALPQLADVFWVAAGDVYAPEFEFPQAAVDRFKASGRLAHLWLVPNPPHNLRGDFGIASDGTALGTAPAGEPSYTFSTIGLYRAECFSLPYCNIAPGNPLGVKAALGPMLRAAMQDGKVSAEVYRGSWTDVGTPQRLAALNEPEGRTAPQ